MDTDRASETILAAQKHIQDRPELTLRTPWPRPEGASKKAFNLLMDQWVVPSIDATRRQFSCLIYWPPLALANEPQPKVGPELRKLYADGKQHNPLRLVWEFFMGPLDPSKRVIQLCAGQGDYAEPGRNLCVHIHHLAITARHHSKTPRPMPEEAVYRHIVLGEPAQLVAHELGCTIRDVRQWVDEIDEAKRRVLTHERVTFLEDLWHGLVVETQPQHRMGLFTDIRKRRAEAMRPANLQRSKSGSCIPDQLHYLPSRWHPTVKPPVGMPPKSSTPLLIGKPRGRREL